MRVMLLGAGGMLGHDLAATAPQDVTVFPFRREELDITDVTALTSAVENLRPDVLINAAAYTAVDRAESEADRAFRVNGEAVGQIGRIARSTATHVVHFSTDYVFDGTGSVPYDEERLTNPVNLYGASKVAGERALSASGAGFLIIRAQWLFGLHGRSFPRTMWERAAARLPSRVVSDQAGHPTHTIDLAEATWRLIALRQDGIMHVSNAGIATWYDVATRVYASLGVSTLVAPCSTADFPTAAKRPLRSVLDTSRFEQVMGTTLPAWEDRIDRFLEQLRALPPRSGIT